MHTCDQCQGYIPQQHQPPLEYHITSLIWPFAHWGLDLIGPFLTSTTQKHYLLVAINYFTTWIKANPLSLVKGKNFEIFFGKNIIYQFDIPQEIITDNVTEF